MSFSLPVLSIRRLALDFLAASFIFYFLFFIFSGAVHAGECDVTGDLTAQEAINTLNKCAIEKNVFDDKIFNINQIAGTADSLYTLLVGESQLHPETNVATRGGGALAASGRMVAVLYSTEPVSGVTYFAQKIQDFNPTQPTYAQTFEGGIGFSTLSPVQDIWSAFRNAAYIGFVIIFVIMGFMIMFRAHISPQAVATVQDSIPRIVVALILVTFSYAIAGLMIDIMFLVINIAINILPGLNKDQAQNVFKESILGIITGAWDELVVSVGKAISTLIQDVLKIGGILGFIDDMLGFFGGVVGGIIVAIAVLFVMFRVFLMLLMAYVTIIILTITAPFFFLIQALPGNNGAKTWFQQMAANVAVFPTVAIMLLFAGLIGGLAHLGGSGESLLEGEVRNFPLLTGGLDVGAIGRLIALGFILMTPSAAQMVKEFIGAKGPAFGGAGATALGAAAGYAAKPLKFAAGPYGEAMGFRRREKAYERMYGERMPGAATQTTPGQKTRS